MQILKRRSDAIYLTEMGAFIARRIKYITDHRDKTVFSIEKMQPLKITALGDYPEGTTLEAPASPYDKWDGKKWVTDLAVKRKSDIADAEKKRQRLLAEVDETTSDWLFYC